MSPKAGKEYQGGGAFGSGGGIFLNSPDLFLLRYLSGGRDHPFLNSFKPCALTSLSVNYTGGGTYATYSDSTPVHMKVSMVFKETNGAKMFLTQTTYILPSAGTVTPMY